ncbi:MAG: tetraacyldisaccharide 4-kinase [Planctomycetota bacterium]|nr:tetraacyldisaccharide 4-kinase [Planctomycetota bacterium]
MNEADYLRLVRGDIRGPAANLGRVALNGASKLYGIGVGLRNVAFNRGWKKTHRVGIPVISIGNITLGGTGKTPMVEWVARWFRQRDLRVAILSRGYGQDEGINDEGRVLEENLPDVPHLQNPDRVSLAHVAVEELESQVLVLDDGFQHRRLGRDLDIVLLDALEPFGLGRIFPRGLLREPVRSLKRAVVVVLSRADLVEPERRLEIRAEAERHAGPLRWVEARHAPLDLVDSHGDAEPLASLTGQRVAAFCGIGNPEGFRKTLQGLGVNSVGFRSFPDHHPYSATDVDDLARWGASVGADLILTTQKDSVKLRTSTLAATPLRALRIGLDITEGRAILDEALGRLLPPDPT